MSIHKLRSHVAASHDMALNPRGFYTVWRVYLDGVEIWHTTDHRKATAMSANINRAIRKFEKQKGEV